MTVFQGTVSDTFPIKGRVVVLMPEGWTGEITLPACICIDGETFPAGGFDFPRAGKIIDQISRGETSDVAILVQGADALAKEWLGRQIVGETVEDGPESSG